MARDTRWGVILRPPPRAMTSRNWCFTLNNPEKKQLLFETLPEVRYAIYQTERGTSGTEHLQGYVELFNPRRWNYLSTLLPGAHFEKRKGTRDQARDYCKKEESRTDGPFEYGDWNSGGSGKRNDLLNIKKQIDEGKSEENIADNYFETWIKYYRGLREYKRIKTTKRNWKTEVTVLVGPPGSGKSRKCLQDATKAYWKQRGHWWDGYENQEHVVIDDYYGWLPYDTLLRLLDRYPMILETKGGHVEFVAKHIWITSNKYPQEWYKSENIEIGALLRRIENTITLGNIPPYNPYS